MKMRTLILAAAFGTALGTTPVSAAFLEFHYRSVCDRGDCGYLGLALGDPISAVLRVHEEAIEPGATIGIDDLLRFTLTLGNFVFSREDLRTAPDEFYIVLDQVSQPIAWEIFVLRPRDDGLFYEFVAGADLPLINFWAFELLRDPGEPPLVEAIGVGGGRLSLVPEPATLLLVGAALTVMLQIRMRATAASRSSRTRHLT
jgi:hypothetical protein